jgi:drug/metabolite transporter (DMT)-like permease
MSAPARPGTRSLALVAIVSANLIGGISYPIQKIALQGLPPATVTLLRNLVALALLLWLVRRRGPLPRWDRADHLRVLAIGTCAFALPMWLGIVGVERSTASNASILILLEPVTILLLAALFLGERITPRQLCGVGLGLAGALVIVLEGASASDLLAGEHLLGNLVLALHGILWGLYTPLAKPLSARHDALDLCLRATLVGVLALVPLALLEHESWQAGPELLPALGWTLALGLFVSFASTWLWLWALAHIAASRVAGFVFLQPLAGVLFGLGLLGESLSTSARIGAGLIVAGVAFDLLRPRQTGRESTG